MESCPESLSEIFLGPSVPPPATGGWGVIHLSWGGSFRKNTGEKLLGSGGCPSRAVGLFETVQMKPFMYIDFQS